MRSRGHDVFYGDDVIEAAGGAVWRVSSRDRLKVVLIHRPRYDDWSLPKGKLERGETAVKAALREVHEETGLHCELGPPLPDVHYTDRKGRPKTVHYWAMRAIAGTFAPSREVDEIRWVRAEDAAALLTYDHDIAVLAALVNLVPVS